MGPGRLGAGFGAGQSERRAARGLPEAAEVSSAAWSQRLAELGIELPEVARPLAAYVPAVRTGNLVYTSGQLPTRSGKLLQEGKVGAEVTAEDGTALARVSALNALAAVHALVGIDSVVRVVKVVGFVASAPGFTGQPAVVNGASRIARRGVRRGRRTRPIRGRGL